VASPTTIRILSYHAVVQTLQHPDRDDLRIETVIAALDHPVRLRIVRTLANGVEMTCQAILPDMTKSTASHHWRILRESGVVEQRREGRYLYQRLRRDDLDSRFPGVLDAVIRG
jgi:DNA-binding transcriptional ArsR family regulator